MDLYEFLLYNYYMDKDKLLEKNVIGVCCGETCTSKHSDDILLMVTTILGVGVGETTLNPRSNKCMVSLPVPEPISNACLFFCSLIRFAANTSVSFGSLSIVSL